MVSFDLNPIQSYRACLSHCVHPTDKCITLLSPSTAFTGSPQSRPYAAASSPVVHAPYCCRHHRRQCPPLSPPPLTPVVGVALAAPTHPSQVRPYEVC